MGFEKRNRPFAKAYMTGTPGNQTLLNAFYTAISFNGQLYDTDGMFTPTSTKIYAKRISGYYLAIGQAYFQNNATGGRYNTIAVNGAQKAKQTILNLGAASEVVVQCSALVYLNVNDYVEMLCMQLSGGNLDVYGDDTGAMTWLALAHISGR